MQVTHSNDFVTHAVIGGKETIDFGISSSAEFFNILSSTLYKDQILAVVREVLCNAWDAHIEAKCTDRPVEVTLTDTKITVRDHGNGIHHDDIGLIYGTYGNSTKKNDGNQTGGFGLGCKAPFAYTDHFEVTSSNGGIKTIYAMAKSSAQVGGKPGITTLAQFPHTETGLTVSIALKPGDHRRFQELVTRIASNGDMNLSLNGAVVKTIGFNTPWVITAENPYTQDATRILVRYGNVIYPVDTSAEPLRDLATKAYAYATKLNSSATVLFQAPAHSIAVTPSRESLSMQDHTVQTLVGLFKSFIAEQDEHFDKECIEVAKKSIDTAIAEKKFFTVLDSQQHLPHAYLDRYRKFAAKATTSAELANVYMHIDYPDSLAFKKLDVEYRVRKLVDAGLVDKGLATTYLKAVAETKQKPRYHNHRVPTDWLHRRVLGKLISKLTAAGLPNKLYIRDYSDHTTESSSDHTVLARNAVPTSIFNLIRYLDNTVVITQSKFNVMDRYQEHFQGKDGFIFYLAGRKKDELEAVQKFFASTKMKVIDLTKIKPKPVNVIPSAKIAPKPKKQGLVGMKSVAEPNGTLNTRQAHFEDASRILSPEFVVQVNTRQSSEFREFVGINRTASELIVKMFGDKGGIATNTVQYKNWSKKYKTAFDYLKPIVLDYVTKSSNIERYVGLSADKATNYSCHLSTYAASKIAKAIYREPLLLKALGIADPRTPEEKQYCELFFAYINRFNDPEVIALRDKLEAIPLDPKAKAVIDKASKAKLISCVDLSQLRLQLGTPSQAKKAMQMFFYALNN